MRVIHHLRPNQLRLSRVYGTQYSVVSDDLPALQDRTPETGKPEKLMDLKGSDLLGLPIKVGG